jgi:hypothetical protein
MRRTAFLLTAGTVSLLALACDGRHYSLGRPGGHARGGNGGASSGTAGGGIGGAGTPATAGIGGAGRGGGKAGMSAGGTAGDAGGSAGTSGSGTGGAGTGGTSVDGGEAGEGGTGTGGIGGMLGGTGGSGVGGAGTGSGGLDALAACMGGTAGIAGSSSSCPACQAATNLVSGCVMFEGALAVDSVRQTVTVISIEDVAGDSCPGSFDDGGQATSRLIVLEATDARRWSVFVRVPDLPTDLVAVNESVELVVEYSEGVFFNRSRQFVSLSRAGERALVVFTGPDTMGPALAAQGIEITRLGKLCEATNQWNCGFEDLRARVKIGSSEAVFDPGETKQVENLQLTIDDHAQWDSGIGGCDNGGVLQGAGFAVPTSMSRSTVLANSR